MQFLSDVIATIQLSVLRGESLGSKILSVLLAVVGVVLFFTGDHIGMTVCLIGFLYEEHQRQIAALRREIRAKKMWHGGEE